MYLQWMYTWFLAVIIILLSLTVNGTLTIKSRFNQ